MSVPDTRKVADLTVEELLEILRKERRLTFDEFLKNLRKGSQSLGDSS